MFLFNTVVNIPQHIDQDEPLCYHEVAKVVPTHTRLTKM